VVECDGANLFLHSGDILVVKKCTSGSGGNDGHRKRCEFGRKVDASTADGAGGSEGDDRPSRWTARFAATLDLDFDSVDFK